MTAKKNQTVKGNTSPLKHIPKEKKKPKKITLQHRRQPSHILELKYKYNQ
jgi:hypothetical protein